MSEEMQIEEIKRDIFAAFGGYEKWEEDWQSLAEAVYNAGYRKQGEPFSRPHENGSEWISVDERLPETPDRVLVYVGDSYLSGTAIDTDRVSDGRWVRWGTLVTHWMPLPEAPKMKGGAE